MTAGRNSDAVREFFRILDATYFAPRGFSKRHHTFTRARGEWAESYAIQGSQWNVLGTPWRFYVNVGLHFDGLPPRVPDRDFPGVHCWSRIEAVVARAPRQFDLPVDGSEPPSALVGDLVDDASRALAASILELREQYVVSRSNYFRLVD
jgi:hypothetical protein